MTEENRARYLVKTFQGLGFLPNPKHVNLIRVLTGISNESTTKIMNEPLKYEMENGEKVMEDADLTFKQAASIKLLPCDLIENDCSDIEDEEESMVCCLGQTTTDNFWTKETFLGCVFFLQSAKSLYWTKQ